MDLEKNAPFIIVLKYMMLVLVVTDLLLSV